MRALAQLPSHFFSGTALALAAIVAMVLGNSCSQPPTPTPKVTPPPGRTKTYACKDRPIKIDKTYGNGVDKDPVVVCIGVSVSWSGKHGWKVSFTTSPFDSGLTDIDDSTAASKLVIKDVGADDAAFKYSVTPADGTKSDPQIIVMGGS